MTTGIGGNERGVTSVVGVVMIVALTILLASVVGVYAFGLSEDATETPNFAALELEFEEERDVIRDNGNKEYGEFLWLIELRHTGGEVVDGEEIVVHLDHGDQRVTGELDGALTAGETVELAVIHNNQNGGYFPDGYEDCDGTNVACRLAGDDGNYPETDRIQLRMIHRPSGTILYEETIGISGTYGIFNGNPESGVDITDETLTFA
ncbi:DUF1628 domain protein [Natronomonas moolapensis 8.8.11]|uniref:DUF1628 domain protein n=1 Tax=Natronomonas moolapensis (strain DSM 18674 / CECT 7526 / JCM 14361 / 8.8.11) TaxID=268739 RepID=M1XKC3_NATM8|nr:type IV pilin N-terminal domain-containing protein [Natronomonas moolapensis]CCQ35636.1 DUF1628 domain protein [Natronomonas moolapensis 8.8.11]